VRRVRTILWIAVAAAAVLAAVLLIASRQTEPARQAAAQVSVGGPFTLTDASGQQFSSSKLRDKPYAIFFGFTHCPEVCPTTLSRLVKLRNELGRGDQAFNIVFVTVDPERDGPKEVGSYAKAFNSPIFGLTGSPAQIDAVKKQFGIFSQKVATGNGDYTVDHTATVLLFGKEGQLAGTISAEEQDPVVLEKLRMLTA
jgi:protein SCO1/2